MNKENIEKTIALIEQSDTFEMIETSTITDCDGRSCETPACIAGHAAYLSNPDLKGWESRPLDIAGSFLDLTRVQMDALFMPVTRLAHYEAEEGDEGFVTKELAIACLKRFVKTGRISWSGARKDVTERTEK